MPTKFKTPSKRPQTPNRGAADFVGHMVAHLNSAAISLHEAARQFSSDGLYPEAADSQSRAQENELQAKWASDWDKRNKRKGGLGKK